MLKLKLKMPQSNRVESNSLKLAQESWENRLIKQNDILLSGYNQNSIDFGELSRKICLKAHAAIRSTLTQLYDMRETERKRNILLTLWSCRELFIKLYVAHSWLKENGKTAARINAAIKELELQIEGIGEVRNALERLIVGLQPTLLPNFDISTAADVLNLGTYARLPVALERIGGIRPFASKEELHKFEESLGPVLLRHLLGNSKDPFPPDFILESIDGGKAHIQYGKLFKFSLSLVVSDTRDKLTFDLNFKDFKVLLGPTLSLRKTLLSDHQIWYLVESLRNNCLRKEAQLNNLQKSLSLVAHSLKILIIQSQIPFLANTKISSFESGRNLVLQFWKSSNCPVIRNGVEIELKISNDQLLLQMRENSLFSRQVGMAEGVYGIDMSHHLLKIHDDSISASQLIHSLMFEIKEAIFSKLLDSVRFPLQSRDGELEWTPFHDQKVLISFDMMSGNLRFRNPMSKLNSSTVTRFFASKLASLGDDFSGLEKLMAKFRSITYFERIHDLSIYTDLCGCILVDKGFEGDLYKLVIGSRGIFEMNIEFDPENLVVKCSGGLLDMSTSMKISNKGSFGHCDLPTAKLPILEDFKHSICNFIRQIMETELQGSGIIGALANTKLESQESCLIDCRIGKFREGLKKSRTVISVDFGLLGSEDEICGKIGRIQHRLCIMKGGDVGAIFIVPIYIPISGPIYLPRDFRFVKVTGKATYLVYEQECVLDIKETWQKYLSNYAIIRDNVMRTANVPKIARFHGFSCSLKLTDESEIYLVDVKDDVKVKADVDVKADVKVKDDVKADVKVKDDFKVDVDGKNFSSQLITVFHPKNPLKIALLSNISNILRPTLSIPEILLFTHISEKILASDLHVRLIAIRSSKHLRLRFRDSYSLDFYIHGSLSPILNGNDQSTTTTTVSASNLDINSFDVKIMQDPLIMVSDITRRMKASSTGPPVIPFPNFTGLAQLANHKLDPHLNVTNTAILVSLKNLDKLLAMISSHVSKKNPSK